eukprot:sb/3476367/
MVTNGAICQRMATIGEKSSIGAKRVIYSCLDNVIRRVKDFIFFVTFESTLQLCGLLFRLLGCSSFTHFVATQSTNFSILCCHATLSVSSALLPSGSRKLTPGLRPGVRADRQGTCQQF